MDIVPDMISTKDLDYISDMYEWNFVLGKKLNHYSNEVKDPEIKEIFNAFKSVHKENCEILLSIISKSEGDDEIEQQ